MTKEERQIVQRLKDASKIQISYDGDTLEFKKTMHNTKKLFFDIGIAVQDYFVKRETY